MTPQKVQILKNFSKFVQVMGSARKRETHRGK